MMDLTQVQDGCLCMRVSSFDAVKGQLTSQHGVFCLAGRLVLSRYHTLQAQSVVSLPLELDEAKAATLLTPGSLFVDLGLETLHLTDFLRSQEVRSRSLFELKRGDDGAILQAHVCEAPFTSPAICDMRGRWADSHSTAGQLQDYTVCGFERFVCKPGHHITATPAHLRDLYTPDGNPTQQLAELLQAGVEWMSQAPNPPPLKAGSLLHNLHYPGRPAAKPAANNAAVAAPKAAHGPPAAVLPAAAPPPPPVLQAAAANGATPNGAGAAAAAPGVPAAAAAEGAAAAVAAAAVDDDGKAVPGVPHPPAAAVPEGGALHVPPAAAPVDDNHAAPAAEGAGQQAAAQDPALVMPAAGLEEDLDHEWDKLLEELDEALVRQQQQQQQQQAAAHAKHRVRMQQQEGERDAKRQRLQQQKQQKRQQQKQPKQHGLAGQAAGEGVELVIRTRAAAKREAAAAAAAQDGKNPAAAAAAAEEEEEENAGPAPKGGGKARQPAVAAAAAAAGRQPLKKPVQERQAGKAQQLPEAEAATMPGLHMRLQPFGEPLNLEAAVGGPGGAAAAAAAAGAGDAAAVLAGPAAAAAGAAQPPAAAAAGAAAAQPAAAAAAQPAAAAAPGPDCPICLDSMSTGSSVTLGCRHQLHADCLAPCLLTDEALCKDSNQYRCPCCKAAKQQGQQLGVVTEQNIRQLVQLGALTPQQEEAINRQQIRRAVGAEFSCIKCSMLLDVEPGPAAAPSAYMVTCGSCNTKQCCSCGVEWCAAHTALTCAQFKAQQAGHMDPKTRQLLAHAVPCPGGCHQGLLKDGDDSCNVLRCTRCRLYVCFLCGDALDSKKFDVQDRYHTAANVHYQQRGTACYDSLWVQKQVWLQQRAAAGRKAGQAGGGLLSDSDDEMGDLEGSFGADPSDDDAEQEEEDEQGEEVEQPARRRLQQVGEQRQRALEPRQQLPVQPAARQQQQAAEQELRRLQAAAAAAERPRQHLPVQPAAGQQEPPLEAQQQQQQAAEQKQQRQQAEAAAAERDRQLLAAEQQRQRQLQLAQAAEEEKQRQLAEQAAEQERQRQQQQAAEQERQRQLQEAAGQERQRQQQQAAEQERQQQEAERQRLQQWQAEEYQRQQQQHRARQQEQERLRLLQVAYSQRQEWQRRQQMAMQQCQYGAPMPGYQQYGHGQQYFNQQYGHGMYYG